MTTRTLCPAGAKCWCRCGRPGSTGPTPCRCGVATRLRPAGRRTSRGWSSRVRWPDSVGAHRGSRSATGSWGSAAVEAQAELIVVPESALGAGPTRSALRAGGRVSGGVLDRVRRVVQSGARLGRESGCSCRERPEEWGPRLCSSRMQPAPSWSPRCGTPSSTMRFGRSEPTWWSSPTASAHTDPSTSRSSWSVPRVSLPSCRLLSTGGRIVVIGVSGAGAKVEINLLQVMAARRLPHRVDPPGTHRSREGRGRPGGRGSRRPPVGGG